MFSKSLLVLSAAAAIASAQTIETSSASSVAASTTVLQSMPPAATQAFNAGNVTETMKFEWCHAQINTCPQICGGAAAVNFCDETTLTYQCTCPNGTVPDVTAFANTLPFFICQETYIQCVANSPNDAQAQSSCAENEKCGSRNATAEAIAATSVVGPATTSGSGSGSASATGGASATSASAAATSSGAAVANHVVTGATGALLLVAMKLFL